MATQAISEEQRQIKEHKLPNNEDLQGHHPSIGRPT